MSSHYKENNFSTENFPTSPTISNVNETKRPNIDDLIKKIIVRRRQERKNTMALGAVCLLVVLLFVFNQN
jgi:hypothetical protein|tara:strand:- start:282 stop:491 length:210 start_codon:yes stop_codon:yes gene_type:complete